MTTVEWCSHSGIQPTHTEVILHPRNMVASRFDHSSPSLVHLQILRQSRWRLLRVMSFFACFSLLMTVGVSASDKFNTKAEGGATGECLPVGHANGSSATDFHCVSSKELAIPCEDEDSECRSWADRGECRQNPQYMLYNCRKSCETCVG